MDLAARGGPQINTISQPHRQQVVVAPVNQVQIEVVLQGRSVQHLEGALRQLSLLGQPWFVSEAALVPIQHVLHVQLVQPRLTIILRGSVLLFLDLLDVGACASGRDEPIHAARHVLH